jgi:Cu/Ag efflux protein CusF
MRMLTCAVAAAALFGASPVAFAADATGKITSVDTSKDMITLDNGSSYMAPKSMKLSDFKVGEKVTVSFTKAGDKMDVTSIKPAT